MAKKTKSNPIEIIDKVEQLLNIWTVPVSATVALIWGFDPTVYVLATVGAINGVLECVKVFLEKK